jgi:hypothetical protein
VGANVGGYPKAQSDSPNTKERRSSNTFDRSQNRRIDRILHRKLKFSIVIHTFTRALAPPFYRETKGLLHSENTLELEEYS